MCLLGRLSVDEFPKIADKHGWKLNKALLSDNKMKDLEQMDMPITKEQKDKDEVVVRYVVRAPVAGPLGSDRQEEACISDRHIRCVGRLVRAVMRRSGAAGTTRTRSPTFPTRVQRFMTKKGKKLRTKVSGGQKTVSLCGGSLCF